MTWSALPRNYVERYSRFSQAPPLGYVPSPSGALPEHVAHIIQWLMMLCSTGAVGACTPSGVSTFLLCAFTVYSLCSLGYPQHSCPQLDGAPGYVASGPLSERARGSR